jgi:uncharacterized protein (TIGR03437 family)
MHAGSAHKPIITLAGVATAAVLIAGAAAPAAAQATLSLDTGGAAAGASVSLNLNLAVSAGAQPAVAQWTFQFSPSIISVVAVGAGSSATAANKSISCTTASGSATCLAFGLDQSTIANGPVATAIFSIAPGTPAGSTPIQVSAVSFAAADSTPITGTGTAGAISITTPVLPSVSSLTCAPGSVTAPGTSACVLGLDMAAPGGGFAVAVASSNANVTVPSPVTVAGGATSVGFNATVAAVSGDQSATISAGSRSFNLSVVAPRFSITGTISPAAAGAGTVLALSGTSSASTTADGSGSFTFSGLLNGSYTIVPSKSAYAFTPVNRSVTVNGANVTGVSFTASQSSVTGVSCTPTSVTGPGSASCTAALDSGAPAGFSLSPSSDNSNVVVPGSVPVATGATTAAFTATVAAVTSDQTAAISVGGRTFALSVKAPRFSISGTVTPSATAGGTTLTLTGSAVGTATADSSGNFTFSGLLNGSYTVTPSKSGYTFNPASSPVTINGANVASLTFAATQTSSPAISSLTCTPSSVTGPGSASCTIGLSSAAPSTGFTALLTSSNSAVTVPASVTIPGGSTTASFTASVAAVSTNQTATLSAVSAISAVAADAAIAPAGQTFVLTAVAPGMSISGTVGPSSMGPGTVLTLSGAASATTTADASGNYKFPGLANGTYTVTPAKAGYTFSPTNKTVTIKGSSVTGVSFTASQVITYLTPAVDVQIWKDQTSISTQITSPTFSTAATGEVLVAFIAADWQSGGNTYVTSVKGAGLTWQLEGRTRNQKGTAEIWCAYAAQRLTSVSVTATLADRSTSSMTIVSFRNADPGSNGSAAVGAIGHGDSSSGAPTARLVTTRANSLIFGVGNDPGGATPRGVGVGQSLIHQYLTADGNTYWVQRRDSAILQSGLSTSIDDFYPSNHPYNLTIAEIRGAAAPATTQSSVGLTSSRVTRGSSRMRDSQLPLDAAVALSSPASGFSGPVCSPGSLATLSGSKLISGASEAAVAPLPTWLAGVQLKVNGSAVPLLYASESEVRFQCPALAPETPLELSLEDESGGVLAEMESVMQAAAPSIFTVGSSDQGVIHIDGRGAPQLSARRGEDLSIFASGLGDVMGDVAPGGAAPADRLLQAKNRVRVAVGEVEVDPSFAGLAPGTVGVYQINLRLPASIPADPKVPMEVRVTLADGTVVSSNQVTLAVSDSR